MIVVTTLLRLRKINIETTKSGHQTNTVLIFDLAALPEPIYVPQIIRANWLQNLAELNKINTTHGTDCESPCDGSHVEFVFLTENNGLSSIKQNRCGSHADLTPRGKKSPEIVFFEISI